VRGGVVLRVGRGKGGDVVVVGGNEVQLARTALTELGQRSLKQGRGVLKWDFQRLMC
jgi:hypothetical protein